MAKKNSWRIFTLHGSGGKKVPTRHSCPGGATFSTLRLDRKKSCQTSGGNAPESSKIHVQEAQSENSHNRSRS